MDIFNNNELGYLEELDMDEMFYNINESHLSSMYYYLKDNNVDIVTEGFKDFINSVVEFFKKMINYIVELAKKVYLYISSYIVNFEKFINKHKDTFRDIEFEPFEVEGYEYNLKTKIPDISFIEDLLSDYSGDLKEYEKIVNEYEKDRKNQNPKKYIIGEREKYASETFYNKVRSSVLGMRKTSEVEKESYINLLNKELRGSEEKVSIDIDKTKVSNLIDDFKNTKEKLKEVEKDKKEMVKIFDKIKSFFGSGLRVYYKEGERKITYSDIEVSGKSFDKGDNIESTYTINKYELYSLFFNYKFSQSKNLSDICISAYTRKIKIMKEANNFYSSILRSVLFKNKKVGDKK
jgi:hypothetical protein